MTKGVSAARGAFGEGKVVSVAAAELVWWGGKGDGSQVVSASHRPRGLQTLF